MTATVRVRFAPSPTGHLHVGHVRTALYNYLLARGSAHRGAEAAYILRIEDTDAERSTPESRRSIIDELRWLGLEWDEGPERGGAYGPYLQSGRYDEFREAARRLIDSGDAYPCFCTPEELDAERAEAQNHGRAYVYSGRCRGLDPAEAAERMEAGEPYALRFRVPAGDTSWREPTDRGEVVFANADIGDFVIWRRPSLEAGHPLYNFTVSVDDIAMAVTHVLRGDDHISNTPRQIMIYRALEAEPPVFVHLPMILGPDRKKLSKRHGATSLAEFRNNGYLPEGLVNYLALLGWSEGTGREVYGLGELVERFSPERLNMTAAVFDYDKCRHINGEQLKALEPVERARRALPFLREAGTVPADLEEGSSAWQRLVTIVDEIGDRAKLLTDYAFYVRPFYHAPTVYDDKAVKKVLKKSGARERLAVARELLAAEGDYNTAALEQRFRERVAELDCGLGKLIQPVRVALTGDRVGIGLFETAELVGQAGTLERVDACLAYMREQGLGA